MMGLYTVKLEDSDESILVSCGSLQELKTRAAKLLELSSDFEFKVIQLELQFEQNSSF